MQYPGGGVAPSRPLGGGSRRRLPLEPLGVVGGTEPREPRSLWPATAICVGGVDRRPLVRCACDDAEAALDVALDTPLLNEVFQDCADSLVPGCGTFADLAVRQRHPGAGEGLEDKEEPRPAPFPLSATIPGNPPTGQSEKMPRASIRLDRKTTSLPLGRGRILQ